MCYLWFFFIQVLFVNFSIFILLLRLHYIWKIPSDVDNDPEVTDSMKEDPALYAAALTLAKEILNTRAGSVYDHQNERAIKYRREATRRNLGIKDLLDEDDNDEEDAESGSNDNKEMEDIVEGQADEEPAIVA